MSLILCKGVLSDIGQKALFEKITDRILITLSAFRETIIGT
jgi:hypothetical protein